MQWCAQAPANIALIKYMGKKDASLNVPENTSLSYTLPGLLSHVQLETLAGSADLWEPLLLPGSIPLDLSQQAQQRFLTHLAVIKKYFNYHGNFMVRSVNNFPANCGLASSASSFAALTQCAVTALTALTQCVPISLDEQAKLSRLGSGSSCRSFYTPWALWTEHTVTAITLPFSELNHQVILISDTEKKISSSHAHTLVKCSSYYPQRLANAAHHLRILLQAFTTQNWQKIYDICWQEFQDMHLLFNRCMPAFNYITPKAQTLLAIIQQQWQTHGDGPVVTMDAGPNIHLLYRLDQINLAKQFKQHYLVGHYDVL